MCMLEPSDVDLEPSNQTSQRSSQRRSEQSIKLRVKVIEGDGNSPDLYPKGRSIVFHVQV